MCFIFSLLQNSIASFNSLLGKEQELAVSAITLSLSNTSTAVFKRNVESTPDEYATATRFKLFKYFFYA